MQSCQSPTCASCPDSWADTGDSGLASPLAEPPALPGSPASSSSSTFTELWHFCLLPILSHICHNCCCHRQVHVVINALLNFISHLEPCRWCSLKDTVVISTIGMAINNEYYPSHVFPSLPTQQIFTARQMIINSIFFLLIKSIFRMRSCHKVSRRQQIPWETAQNIWAASAPTRVPFSKSKAFILICLLRSRSLLGSRNQVRGWKCREKVQILLMLSLYRSRAQHNF